MRTNDWHKDQAEELRKRMEQQASAGENDQTGSYDPYTVSHLPPRSEVHKGKKKKKNPEKKNQKFKYPLIRILVIFFILLPFIIISIYTFSKGTGPAGQERKDFEELHFEEDYERSPERNLE